MSAKVFLKSVNIWQSYDKTQWDTFLTHGVVKHTKTNANIQPNAPHRNLYLTATSKAWCKILFIKYDNVPQKSEL